MSANNMYEISGNIVIPNDKRDEFNRKVLKLLERGGIRKTETIYVDEREFTVVVPAKPNEHGIISFDYSIFEKEIMPTSTFNLNTGELIVPQKGYTEFAIIMYSIMVLQIAYSSEQCSLIHNNKPASAKGYIALINTILDEKIEYHEHIPDSEMDFRENEPLCRFPLYWAFRRDNEDEFLEWWNGSNLHISSDMKHQIHIWKTVWEDFSKCSKIRDDIRMEPLMGSVLTEMQEIWECRFVDKRFVDEFLELLILLREYMQLGTHYFPELTEDQVKRSLLLEIRDSYDEIKISGYVSLMTNHDQRKQIFGL